MSTVFADRGGKIAGIGRRAYDSGMTRALHIIDEATPRDCLTQLTMLAGEEDCVVGPGFIWHWPFNIDEIIVTNVVFETAPIADLQIETKDGIAINAQPVVGYCIINVRKFLLEVEEATSAVVDVAGGAIVEAVRKKTWEEIKADTEFTRKIRDVVARRANERFGIEIQSMYFHSLVRMGFRHGVLKLAWQQ